MFFSAALALAGANVALAASSASRPAESTIEPAATAISALAAAATPVVLTSDVKGKGFDRIVQIWLENTVSYPAFL
jgi:acid phosphatase